MNKLNYLPSTLFHEQLDEDPDCFRRIISYLQIKSLLGDNAPKEVRTCRSPCQHRDLPIVVIALT